MSFARLSTSLRRLSVRLTLWHSLLFMGSATALLALTYLLLRNRADATEHYVVESRLNQYASEYKRSGLEGVRHLATLRRGRAQQAFFVRVGDAQNRTVFLRHADDWAEFHPERLDGQRLPPVDLRSWQSLPSDDGTKLLIGAERLPNGGVLQVGKANEDLKDLLSDYRRATLLVLLIIVPASFVGGAFVASRALRPVQQLTSVAQEIIETNRLDARVPSPGSGDELDALVHVFNKMLSRIQALVRGMRESIDNVAHDLRTPLTRLRHKAQSVIETEQEKAPGTQCATCGAAMNALADCVEEADRVTTILSTLMDIAEAEAGLAKLAIAPVPLDKLVADTVDSYVECADDRGVSVGFQVPPDLRVRADATALFRVFANLLDNAIKYTPSGGRVQITAERRDGFAEIRFNDNGIGISAEDLPRIWDRLFRGDRSRSRRGLGLGLSFVRAIVEAHGGTVHAEGQLGKGTTLRVLLPAEARIEHDDLVEAHPPPAEARPDERPSPPHPA
jgi:signal transduction histidine kinase